MNIVKSTGSIILLLSIFFIIPTSAQKTELNSSKFLFLDNRIIEQAENAILEVGKVEKHKNNPLFGEEKNWEIRFDNLYGNIIFDEKMNLYRLWYSPFIVDHSAKGMTLKQRQKEYPAGKGIKREMGICYATSVDGLNWNKPNLGLVDYEGSNQNNIIWRNPHGAGIFKDDHESNPNKQFKAIMQGLAVSFSADGINWSGRTKVKGVSVPGDTHNNAFWAPTLNKYVGITRTRSEEFGREVARIESDDFIHWTEEEVVLRGENINLQPYSMPVFYYKGVYLGLVAIHNQETDRVHTELSWSPDTKQWFRISPGTPLIPTSNKKLDYDYGCAYACAYPIIKEDKIMLYYGGSDYLHFGWRNGFLCLATLRPDGFAGYVQENENEDGSITTKLLQINDPDLKLTADVNEGGSIVVSVVDSDEKILGPPVTISKTITNESIELFKGISDKNFKLNFKFKNAKLYSFEI